MHLHTPTALLTTALLLLLHATTQAAAASRPKNAVLLSNVQSLTLRGGGAKTSHRRVAAIPQLRCVSPAAVCRLHEVDVMRCLNQGSSYGDEDVEWSCSASLPEDLKLGSTDVICEGYASPDDPYVLKGSCGVEYRLVLTDKGRASHPDAANSRSWFGDSGGGEDQDSSGRVFFIIVVAIFLWILYSAYQSYRNPQRPGGGQIRGGGPGGGGGGGGGGWNPGWGPDNDPPPPYPGTKKSSSTQQQQGWTPGFWSGVAGGAAAGYMAGRRNDNDRYRDRGSRSGWGSDAGPSMRPSSSSSGTSSARYESTGFGSTSRR